MKRIDDYLDFLLQEKGEDILFKGQNKKAIISDAKNKINFYDDKFIRTDFEIKTGNVITYQDRKWLIISEVDKNKKSYKARMRKSNFDINFIINNDVKNINSIIENLKFTLDDSNAIPLDDYDIRVIMGDSEVTENIDVNDRFIKMGKAWKVVGIDKTKKGLLILECNKDSFVSGDDKENEIANADSLKPPIPTTDYSIELEPSMTGTYNDFRVIIDYENTFTAKVKNNDTLVDEPVQFSITGDVNQLEIMSQTDKEITLKGKDFGNITLTVALKKDNTVTISKDMPIEYIY
ncbi:hypothetical protein [Dethiothermospora halolimnae]|uniref:hypothetical protein n=1 Tax=Dethiothermospora halolimnae TaxID=3114390 RepID=UPI003CCC0EE8